MNSKAIDKLSRSSHANKERLSKSKHVAIEHVLQRKLSLQNKREVNERGERSYKFKVVLFKALVICVSLLLDVKSNNKTF